jgi:hypothetical protein
MAVKNRRAFYRYALKLITRESPDRGFKLVQRKMYGRGRDQRPLLSASSTLPGCTSP